MLTLSDIKNMQTLRYLKKIQLLFNNSVIFVHGSFLAFAARWKQKIEFRSC